MTNTTAPSPAAGVQILRKWAYLDNGPNPDLGLLARLLGASGIETRPLLEEGRIAHNGRGTTILVRVDSPRSRQRFTVGHELGHLVIGMGLVPSPPERAVETWCNGFAAELLAPRHWVRKGFSARPRSIQTIRHLADEADVSLSLALLRLRDLCHWDEVLLHWRRFDRGWEYDWAVGLTNAELRMLRRLQPRARVATGCLNVFLNGERQPRTWRGELRCTSSRSLYQLSSDTVIPTPGAADSRLYATKREERPRILAVGGASHATPQWSNKRSR